MMFLFDDEHGQSQYRDCPNWTVAENYAEDMGWELIGEFVSYIDPETGEEVHIQ